MIQHGRELTGVLSAASAARVEELPSPYVKTYLLPDMHKVTKRKTRVIRRNRHPTFMEMLVYRLPLEHVQKRLLQVKYTSCFFLKSRTALRPALKVLYNHHHNLCHRSGFRLELRSSSRESIPRRRQSTTRIAQSQRGARSLVSPRSIAHVKLSKKKKQLQLVGYSSRIFNRTRSKKDASVA